MEFLSAENLCGQTLLRLVSRGNAVIAELLRLSEHTAFVFEPRYERLLFDFGYWKKFDVLEAGLARDDALMDMDEEFNENHFDLLERFYLKS